MVICITVPSVCAQIVATLIRRVADLLRLFRLRCGTAYDHLIEQLPDQSQRVDLIVMLAGRKAQQFRPKVGVPRRAFRHVQAVECHAPADQLRAARFVAPCRKLLAIHVSLTLTRTLIEEWPNARADLPLLLGPLQRLPFEREITERIDPLVRRGLAPPHVEQIDTLLRIRNHGRYAVF